MEFVQEMHRIPYKTVQIYHYHLIPFFVVLKITTTFILEIDIKRCKTLHHSLLFQLQVRV